MRSSLTDTPTPSGPSSRGGRCRYPSGSVAFRARCSLFAWLRTLRAPLIFLPRLLYLVYAILPHSTEAMVQLQIRHCSVIDPDFDQYGSITFRKIPVLMHQNLVGLSLDLEDPVNPRLEIRESSSLKSRFGIVELRVVRLRVRRP